jgi:hypothetical protein
MSTRRCCTACRLAKCFAVGMSSDLIRKEVRRYTKHSSSSQSGTTGNPGSKQAIVRISD